MQELINMVPDVVVVGDIEMLFLGMALAVGMPKMAQKALQARYNRKVNTEAGDAAVEDKQNSE